MDAVDANLGFIAREVKAYEQPDDYRDDQSD
jgi:hypothetical protein